MDYALDLRLTYLKIWLVDLGSSLNYLTPIFLKNNSFFNLEMGNSAPLDITA